MKQILTVFFFALVANTYAQIESDSLLGPTQLDEQTVYYLLEVSNGIPNDKGFVKLHKTFNSEDSAWVNPRAVYKLYLMPDDESKVFPAVIYNFINIQELWIGMRGFDAIPEDIVTLTNLQSLDVQHCPISSIPEQLAVLENLHDINLTGTKVKNNDANIKLIKEKITNCNFWMPDGSKL